MRFVLFSLGLFLKHRLAYGLLLCRYSDDGRKGIYLCPLGNRFVQWGLFGGIGACFRKVFEMRSFFRIYSVLKKTRFGIFGSRDLLEIRYQIYCLDYPIKYLIVRLFSLLNSQMLLNLIFKVFLNFIQN